MSYTLTFFTLEKRAPDNDFYGVFNYGAGTFSTRLGTGAEGNIILSQ